MNEAGNNAPDRLEALETRVAYQEQTIADLNEMISEQWQKIEALERALARLHEDIRSLERPRESPEPPPPHY